MSVQQLTPDFFDKENLAVVLYAKKDIRIEKWPLPDKLDPEDVLIHSQFTGICGTDIHLWKHGVVADFVLSKPFCLGHEPSGVVMKIGSNVKKLKEGDHVAIEPGIPCSKCDLCREGRYNLCPVARIHGLPSVDGSLRRYYTHRADYCFKLPTSISLEEGALVEALAVAVHACRRVRVKAGNDVLVCGAGPIGLMAMLTAKAFGAASVCITDIKQSRLDFAKKLGADNTYFINIKEKFDDKKVAKEIVQLFNNEAPSISIECTGVETSQAMAIHATRSGGRVAIVGLGPTMNRIPINTATMREIDLVGVCRIKDDYPTAIKLMQSKKINLKPFITHCFSIEKAMDAFKFIQDNPDVCIKVLIGYQN